MNRGFPTTFVGLEQLVTADESESVKISNVLLQEELASSYPAACFMNIGEYMASRRRKREGNFSREASSSPSRLAKSPD